MNKVIIILFTLLFIKPVYSESVVIKKSAPYDPVRVTVLPIKYFGSKRDEALIVTDQLIRTLSSTTFIKVIPLKTTIETLWEYFPDQFSVKPDKYSPTKKPPEGIELFGQLTPVQKEVLSTHLSSEYIIDGTYVKEDNARFLAIDIYSEKDRCIKKSFSKKLTSDETVFESAMMLGKEVTKYFFDILSDDIVLKILQARSAEKISLDDAILRLDELETSYRENIFVLSGKLVLYHDSQASPDKIISVGERWFALRNRHPSKQIRFFQSTDLNPYLILAKAYMKKQRYHDAKRVFNQGNKTFPFNTERLKKTFGLCLELIEENNLQSRESD